jgi:hypothetical protein
MEVTVKLSMSPAQENQVQVSLVNAEQVARRINSPQRGGHREAHYVICTGKSYTIQVHAVQVARNLTAPQRGGNSIKSSASWDLVNAGQFVGRPTAPQP